MNDHPAPRFSLRQLLAAISLFAFGLALIAIGTQMGWWDDLARSATLWLISGMLIGAGVLMPFNRATLGALCGFAIQLLTGLFIIITKVAASPF